MGRVRETGFSLGDGGNRRVTGTLPRPPQAPRGWFCAAPRFHVLLLPTPAPAALLRTLSSDTGACLA